MMKKIKQSAGIRCVRSVGMLCVAEILVKLSRAKLLWWFALIVFLPVKGMSEIYTPAIISDNMVLQSDSEVTIWGWTTKTAEHISVWGSWGSDTVTAQADLGRWQVKLSTPAKGDGAYEIYISGHQLVTIKNVLIGEVWLCSGQSNMEMPVDSLGRGFSGVPDFREKIKEAGNPSIRLFKVAKRVADYPQDDVTGEWVECTPETVKDFSAVGYFFGKALNGRLEKPVGLIHASWGGTNAETWMPAEIIGNNEEFRNGVTNPARKSRPSQPAQAYNAMIYPLTKFNIAGAIWYQGESNRFSPAHYDKLLATLIGSWRRDWGKDFPFYYVQIAPFNYKDTPAVLIREGQLKAMSVPNTGMVVTNDIGDLGNIHPRNKREVGRRLALWALSQTYGFSDIPYSGPLYRSMKVEKNAIILEFNHAENGLIKKGKHLTGFEIAGKDRNFVEAKAVIRGNKVAVSSKEVPEPLAVRFAFSDTAQPNLYNRADLPASAFRTDNWPLK